MKIIEEFEYSQELLQEYINKPKYKFIWFIGDKMVFSIENKEVTKRQVVELTRTEKFFEMFKTWTFDNLFIEDIFKELNLQINKETKEDLLKFVNYRSEKWDRDKKSKWEKEKTFELLSRLRTWYSNQKKFKWNNTNNNWLWIAEI